MNKYLALASTIVASVAATPALAEDPAPSAVTITGSASVTTQYRLRGISQTDNDAAIQGGVTITHSSGLYVGTWASNLAGYGTFGGSNMELDAIVGATRAVGAVTLDGGVVYYLYPGTTGHDYVEVYGSAASKIGPLNAKLSTYWAPQQSHIGGHNVWAYADLGLPIEHTPLTLKAHAGYSHGNSAYTKGNAAGGNSDGVFDYGVGVDVSYRALTLNVAYVGTDIASTQSTARWAPHPMADRSPKATPSQR